MKYFMRGRAGIADLILQLRSNSFACLELFDYTATRSFVLWSLLIVFVGKLPVAAVSEALAFLCIVPFDRYF
jgi:hypothetical protein